MEQISRISSLRKSQTEADRSSKRATKWTDSLTAVMVLGLKYGSNDEPLEGRSKYTVLSANEKPHCKSDIKKRNCAFITAIWFSEMGLNLYRRGN